MSYTLVNIQTKNSAMPIPLRLIMLVVFTIHLTTALAKEGLQVFTSSNAESNALQSFVVVPDKVKIPEGITSQSQKEFLAKQLPFKIELLDEIEDAHQVQWKVTILQNAFGQIRIKSTHAGKNQVGADTTSWTSDRLGKKAPDRHILIFEPLIQKHDFASYKKEEANHSSGISRGGTASIAIKGRNPRLAYRVEASIINVSGETIRSYTSSIEMDNKDLLRQEYINHFGIALASAGALKKLPVPSRADIKTIPPRPQGYDGTALTESEYGLMIEGGAVKLASQILEAYESKKHFYHQAGNQLRDLNGNIFTIPDSRLWISSGWRNPELDEWFSEGLNGSHQLGTALDLIPNEIPRTRNAAIVYWVLWESIKSMPNKHRVFAQLESLAVPGRKSSFIIDIEPKNGIPDAFDTADHLHINLLNE